MVQTEHADLNEKFNELEFQEYSISKHKLRELKRYFNKDGTLQVFIISFIYKNE